MARVKLPKAIIIQILLRLPVKSLLRFKFVSKEWFSVISSSEFVEAHLKNSSNPDYIMDFPEDMIFEILLRLPAKSILRFQCVSKEWLSLISSSFFVKSHLKISTENKLIIGRRINPAVLYSCSLQSLIEAPPIRNALTDENAELDHVPFECPSVGSGNSFWFVDSCNGLVCLRFPCDHNTTIFWNPTTRKSRMLPFPDMSSDYSCRVIGFGYDELHDDYKVMELFSVDDVMSDLMRVFSFKSNSWKFLPNMLDSDISMYEEYGKFIHGAIHWTGYSDKQGEFTVYSFDLATETFAELPMPKSEETGYHYYEIAVLGGCLAISINSYRYVEVWLMKEYGRSESWTRVVRIPFYPKLWGNVIASYPRVVFLLGNDKIVLNYGTSLRIYDLREKQPHHFNATSKFDAITYVESLVSPYHGRDLDKS